MFVAEDYKWVGTLGTPNQFRGVKYAESTDDNYCRVRCLLCGTGWMGRGARINHFHGDNHAARYRGVQRLQQEVRRREEMRLLEPRVKQLGLEIWRNDVNSKMYEYLCNDTPQSPAVILASYERKEMLSLLELAL